MHRIPVSVIILTYNEERNIEACLKTICDWADEIFIVDSCSTDKTLEIARKYTDKIYKHSFENQAKQFNWALENLPIKNEWIMRLDADERWNPKALYELSEIIKEKEVYGVYIKLKIYFMDKWIKYGGFYPNYFLRVFRKGKATIEDRLMDEHIFVDGNTVVLKNDVVEYNENDRNYSITNWTVKHNGYATREAVEQMISKYNIRKLQTISDLKGAKTEQKRWVKENVYSKFPLFFRVFIYFIFRYIFKLGFLDGKEGLIFHFLQGFWYRFLVDVKIYEIEKAAKDSGKDIKSVIEELHCIKLENS
ncbi:MAG: glycosyltransferase family 2 protein [Spirochaetes bacterium]|nr:glycosyltransferase family 2 protein [Spirochaetota bacterium]